MAHWNSTDPDIDRIDTGKLPPMEWQSVESALLAARARAGIEPREWIQTAKERAYRARLDHKLQYRGIRNGVILYGAPMPHNPTQEYRVTIDFPGKDIQCNCPLRQRGLPCAHVGAAIILLEEMPGRTATRACTSLREIDIWSAALHG